MLNYLKDIFMTIIGYLEADWYLLLIGIILAVAVSVYINSDKLKSFMRKNARISIPGAVAIGAFTPLCACGTFAVLISFFVSTVPWGTIMAFIISSPLTSPSEYMFETAFFGSRLATGNLVASLILGLLAGAAAHLLEKRTHFFDGQFRFAKQENDGCACAGNDETAADCCNEKDDAAKSCSCGEDKPVCCSHNGFIKKYKVDKLVNEFWNTGIKKILLYFIVFIALGRTVEMLIPGEWIMMLFGSNNAYSVPLGAAIGLPLYLTDSSAIPLLKSLINSGAGEGAVLAFLIAGKATGVPVIAGLAAFLKKRAMLFYLGFIYFGAVFAGYLYQLIVQLIK